MPRSGRRFPASRRIIESSESGDSEPDQPHKPVRKSPAKRPLTEDVIELTSSSEDEVAPALPNPTPTSCEKASQDKLPSYVSQEDDGAIVVLYAQVLVSDLDILN